MYEKEIESLNFTLKHDKNKSELAIEEMEKANKI